MDRLRGIRTLEPPKIVDEQPILLMIIAEGGVLIFSHPLSEEWKFDDDLFGGFLTAFNSINDEIFSEGLDRVKFGNHTVLIEPIESFSVCYLFKGQTYPAKQKLIKFIDRIKNDAATLMTLDKYNTTNRVVELIDVPFIKNLLIEIFKLGRKIS